jgi:hypothetical protein
MFSSRLLLVAAILVLICFAGLAIAFYLDGWRWTAYATATTVGALIPAFYMGWLREIEIESRLSADDYQTYRELKWALHQKHSKSRKANARLMMIPGIAYLALRMMIPALMNPGIPPALPGNVEWVCVGVACTLVALPFLIVGQADMRKDHWMIQEFLKDASESSHLA